MNRWLAALGIFMGLGVVAGVAGTVVLVVDSRSGLSGEPDVASSGLSSVAGDLERHAGELTEHASVMIELGQEPGRDAWIEKGTDLLGDARRMRALADQITRTRRDLALFPPGDSVNIYRLRADGRALVEAGQELADHGAVLEEEAEIMVNEGRAASSPQLESGAILLKLSAETLIEDGRRVMSVGRPLVAQADQLERSLGH